MLPPVLRLVATAAALLMPLRATADFSVEKLRLIDRPFQGEQVALSPDGRRVAFTRPAGTRLELVIQDLESRTLKVALLAEARRDRDRTPRLARLRWLTDARLLLVNSDSEIIAIDATGENPLRLWNPDDAGLVSSLEFESEELIVRAEVPRIHPPLVDRPGTLLIESVARIGAESFSNAFLVDVVTGEQTLLNSRDYLPYQIALYGRGDMLVWPPLTPDVARWITPRGNPPPGLLDLHRYFESRGGAAGIVPPPHLTRLKFEDFLARPPILNGDAYELAGWPMTLNVPPPGSPPTPPPNQNLLIPETGAAISPESSASGRMLYDRLGRPRILYPEHATGGPRRFLYTAPGERVFEPNAKPRTLDEFLGHQAPGEFVVSAENYFGERSYPLAFDYDPDVVYIASNIGRDTFAIYALNLVTRQRTEIAADPLLDLASGDPAETDDILVFDEETRKLVGIRYTSIRRLVRWLDPALAEIQSRLNSRYPEHSGEILGWDRTRQRFLVSATSEEDTGGVFLYVPAEDRLELLFTRTPWLAEVPVSSTAAFGFRTPSGVLLSGYLTLPDDPKLTPPPLVIWCQGGLWDRARAGFNREAQMLADMGVAVVRLNYRGSAGFGRKHITALVEHLDTAPAEDFSALVAYLGSTRRIDPNRVILMGEGFGGYVAQRALQLNPSKFRAGILINAPTNLTAWARPRPIPVRGMYRDGTLFEPAGTTDFRSEVRAAFIQRARAASGESAERPRGAADRPVLVIESASSTDTTPVASFFADLGLAPGGLRIDRLRIGGPFEDGAPADRERVFLRVERFLNETAYQFEVEAGDLRKIEDLPDPRRK